MLTCTECGREGSRGFANDPARNSWRCANVDQCAARIAKAQRAEQAGRCVDCRAEGLDPKGHRVIATKDDGSAQPGPRCVSHWRDRKKHVSQAGHDRRIGENYELTPQQYNELYVAQDCRCFICRKSTGKARRLAVDHDHKLALEHGHDPAKGCVLCIRALLCKRCNTLVGWLDVEALQRAIVLLVDPPARKILTTPVVGEPTAIPPTMPGVEIDETMDPALIEAIDQVVEPTDSFWDAEADASLSPDFASWFGNSSDNFWSYPEPDDVGSPP